MVFDVIIGNPPYQQMDGGGYATSASAIYHRFIDNGLRLSGRFTEMIVPSRWISDSPRGMSQDWLNYFRSNPHFRALIDYEQANDVFDDVVIKGGVCYFLIDNEYNGYAHRTYITSDRRYDWNDIISRGYGTIIRDYRKLSIIDKVKADEYMSDFVQSTTPFQKDRGNDSDFGTNWTGYQDTEDKEHTVKYYTKKQKSGFGFIERDRVIKGYELIDKPKILLQNSQTIDGTVLYRPLCVDSNQVCSSSWGVLASDRYLRTFEECQNCYKYILTKFVRFLISAVKNTQHQAKEVYRLVPMMNFGNLDSGSDIDWSKQIEDIDKQLYKKYNLSQEEIDYIESTIAYLKS